MSANYYRAFLPIKQERSDYSQSGREAVGKAIIEAKGGAGKISVSIQNVKKNSHMGVYAIANVSGGYIGVYIGRLLINELGKGDCRYEFDADNVMKSGIAVDAFTIVALIVPKEVELIAPFVGYKNEPVAWKINFKYFVKAKEPEAKKEEKTAEEEIKEEVMVKEEVLEETIEEEATEEVVEKEMGEEVAEEEVIEKKIREEELAEKEIIEDETAEIKTTEGAISEETHEEAVNPHEKFKGIVKKFTEKLEELKPADKQDCAEPIDEEIEKLFETNTVMYPFKQKKSDVTWVRVSPKNLLKLPPEFSRLTNCSLVLNGFRSFKHLILGKYYSDGAVGFLIGVPDIFYQQKKQIADEYGFHKFECCDGGEIFNGAYGYWIIVI